MQVDVSGLFAIMALTGFVAVSAVPVWLAARFVHADYPTMPRSILSLVTACGICTVGAYLGLGGSGALVAVLVPLAFLLSFNFIIGTSVVRAVLLAILAAALYVLMVKVTGVRFDVAGVQ